MLGSPVSSPVSPVSDAPEPDPAPSASPSPPTSADPAPLPPVAEPAPDPVVAPEPVADPDPLPADPVVPVPVFGPTGCATRTATGAASTTPATIAMRLCFMG